MSSVLTTFSQQILLEENVKFDKDRPTHGQNLKNFAQFYTGPLMMIPQLDQNTKGYLFSMGFHLGYRYKRRLNNTIAMGYDFSYTRCDYGIAQDTPKVSNNSVKFIEEQIKLNTLGTGVFMRINFGRRGNIIGKYIDLTGFANWNFSKVYYAKEKLITDQIQKRWYPNQKCVEPFQYGLGVRFGVNRYEISCQYRVSDIIKTKNTNSDPIWLNAELPRIMIGIEIGIYK
ncbi:MAG: hypothetical protein V2A54_05515 [Bacteroidota bacterium]